jgi:chemotaxis protein MotA
MILMPLLIALSGFIMTISIRHLGQSVSSYYDFVALVMVFGGTITVGAVLLPWEYKKDIKLAFKFLLRSEKTRYRPAMTEIIAMLNLGRVSNGVPKTYLYQRMLHDGAELIQLGFSRSKIEEIISERVFHSIKRWKKVSSALRSLAKYPPAFGLMGTVFGLVNIMKSLAGTADAGKLGVEMSVALVATMYGLLVANFIVNPIAELMAKKAEEEEECAQLALEAVLMLKDQTPLLECIEMLNSFVPEDQRQGFTDIAAEDLSA